MQDKDMIQELQHISNAIGVASKYSMEAEVILFSMKALQKDPKLSIEDALEIGLEEFIK